MRTVSSFFQGRTRSLSLSLTCRSFDVNRGDVGGEAVFLFFSWRECTAAIKPA